MSFLEIISTILIEPLIWVFEMIYVIANRVIDNPGLSIIVLSLVMNFLVLPLYMRADAMQEEEKEMEKRLRKGVAHIKKTFKGDERMMILQTYYRQNDYKPTYVLRGAVSLFLEIPFFIAAYRFLSELQLLQGVAFGPIADLGKPDGLLTIGGTTINILPVIMTSVNLVSCIIFTKGSSVKQKVQLYGMALFFLVFLYTSPSGLVFYWTLNNVFSLIKTIFYKLKNPAKVLSFMASAAGICIIVYGKFFYFLPTVKRMTLFVSCGLLLQLPILYMFLKNKIHKNSKGIQAAASRKIFTAGCIFMTLLTGVLIPSAVLKSSPQEFVDVNYFYHPGGYIANSVCLAAGIFLVWGSVFYWLAKPSVKVLFDRGIWVIAGIATVNYMFFGKDLGILNNELKYEQGLDFSFKDQLLNLLIVVVVAAVLWYIAVRLKKKTFDILIIVSAAIAVMSVTNIVNINSSVKGINEQALENEEMPRLTLSKDGKNVVVLMMDRALGVLPPYIFNEKPELKEKFEGFTYYANTLSFGGFTNFGIPALFGGYEYTPVEMNKREEEALVDKHNEALKMMPVLFDENGYDVTVCDPTYANYQWIPDLSIFDEYPDIKKYNTRGKFSDTAAKEQVIQNNKIRFFCYGILKTSPLCLQELLYDKGNYNLSEKIANDQTKYTGQTVHDLSTAEGLYERFMDPYSVVENLTNITDVSNTDTNTFLYMTNDMTHEPMLLQTPEYLPAEQVDNKEYDEKNKGRFEVNDFALNMENTDQMMHYHINMAAYQQLGKWLDYLRENDVYDNTRIIIVADHGRGLKYSDDRMLDDGSDIDHFYPLLMVKDFDSKGFTTSEEFMTNADVPTLAVDGLIEDPRNPFTGKEINSDEKTAHDQYVFRSDGWDVNENNGNIFLPGKWFAVKDDMRDKNNWKLIEENGVLMGEQ